MDTKLYSWCVLSENNQYKASTSIMEINGTALVILISFPTISWNLIQLFEKKQNRREESIKNKKTFGVFCTRIYQTKKNKTECLKDNEHRESIEDECTTKMKQKTHQTGPKNNTSRNDSTKLEVNKNNRTQEENPHKIEARLTMEQRCSTQCQVEHRSNRENNVGLKSAQRR